MYNVNEKISITFKNEVIEATVLYIATDLSKERVNELRENNLYRKIDKFIPIKAFDLCVDNFSTRAPIDGKSMRLRYTTNRTNVMYLVVANNKEDYYIISSDDIINTY